jgi:hypothetical protein
MAKLRAWPHTANMSFGADLEPTVCQALAQDNIGWKNLLYGRMSGFWQDAKTRMARTDSDLLEAQRVALDEPHNPGSLGNQLGDVDASQPHLPFPNAPVAHGRP